MTIVVIGSLRVKVVSVWVAKHLAHLTSDHEMLDANRARGIHLKTLWCFIAQSLSLSPLHHFDMTNNFERGVKHLIIIIIMSQY